MYQVGGKRKVLYSKLWIHDTMSSKLYSERRLGILLLYGIPGYNRIQRKETSFMERYLLTVIPEFAPSDRDRIRQAAEERGFTSLFYNSPEEAAEILPEAEIVFGYDRSLALEEGALKWLCTPFAGINQFVDKNIFLNGQAVLTNSSGAYGTAIAEHIIMILLEILRREKDYEEIIAGRGWVRDLPIRSIRGSRITLMGTGDIGQETALRLRSFSPASMIGMNRKGGNPGGLFDRIIGREELKEVLPGTDVLILSLPGTPDTKGILGKEELALLPDGAVIINVGRGTSINQSALENELLSGRLSAGLDVFEKEPISADSPLWSCRSLILTPHIAGNMMLPFTVDRIVQMFLEDLDRYCTGKPLLHLADVRAGY